MTGVGGIQRGRRVCPEPSRPRRKTRASVQATDDPPPDFHVEDAVSATEEEEEVAEEVVQLRGMKWSMLVPSANGVVSSAGVSTDSTAAAQYHPDEAEATYLQYDRDEREAVEKSSAHAKNTAEMIWLSDTQSTKLSDAFQTRIKAFADGATSALAAAGGAKRRCTSFHDLNAEGADATAHRRCVSRAPAH